MKPRLLITLAVIALVAIAGALAFKFLYLDKQHQPEPVHESSPPVKQPVLPPPPPVEIDSTETMVEPEPEVPAESPKVGLTEIQPAQEAAQDEPVYYKLTGSDVFYLKESGIPATVLDSLGTLRDQEFENESEFRMALEAALGEDLFKTYYPQLEAVAKRSESSKPFKMPDPAVTKGTYPPHPWAIQLSAQSYPIEEAKSLAEEWRGRGYSAYWVKSNGVKDMDEFHYVVLVGSFASRAVAATKLNEWIAQNLLGEEAMFVRHPYTISVGEFEDRDQIDAAIQMLWEKGYAAYAQSSAVVPVYRVCVGSFPDRESAMVMLQLMNSDQLGGVIVER